MSIKEDMRPGVHTICYLLESFEDVSEQVKQHLEGFISDTTVPLEERWAIWVNAPDSLKNHQSWVHFWVTDEFLEGVGGNAEIYYVMRGQTICVVDVFLSLQENFTDECLVEIGITQEDINREKEQILKLNLGSYCYDWYW